VSAIYVKIIYLIEGLIFDSTLHIDL